ncbi:LysM peptidoglycan-binding domain-containing protein [Parafrankia sp. EUN1f]|uniref:LysM peptidoglycan-binding domain-containing protein n=1 Tax=Parafrankia sp. EUN1f TaxID=102897 RepID=UPI0018DB06F8|nr:hypothetical protein [Parafrankia sp. EUN1f]
MESAAGTGDGHSRPRSGSGSLAPRSRAVVSTTGSAYAATTGSSYAAPAPASTGPMPIRQRPTGDVAGGPASTTVPARRFRWDEHASAPRELTAGEESPADLFPDGVDVKFCEVRPADGRQHDTLWAIARRLLGDSLRYRELFTLNEGRTQPDGQVLSAPSLVAPGWVLLLPPDAAGEEVRTIRVPHREASWIHEVHSHFAAQREAETSQPTAHTGPTAPGTSGSGAGSATGPLQTGPVGTGWPGATAGGPSTTGGWTGAPGPADHRQGQHYRPGYESPAAGAGGTTAAAASTGPTTAPGPAGRAGTAGPRGQRGGHDDRTGAASASAASRAASGRIGGGRGISGAALLAAGVLTALTRRRSGDANADPFSAEVEHALRLAADLPSARFVDRSLRLLSAGLTARGRELPPVYAAILTDAALVLHMAPAVAKPPPSPWQVGNNPGSWRIERNPDAPDGLPFEASASLSADVPAPYPALVTVGRDDTGCRILVDLEGAPGVIALTGDPAVASEAAISVAVELATNIWSDDLRVCLVGFADDPSPIAPGRLRTSSSLADILDELEAREPRDTAWGAEPGAALRGRQSPAAPAEWSPDLLVLAGPPAPAHAERLARLAGGRDHTVGVLMVGDSPAARWRFDVQPDARMSLGVLGVEVNAQTLAAAEYAAMLAMFRIQAGGSRGTAVPRPPWASTPSYSPADYDGYDDDHSDGPAGYEDDHDDGPVDDDHDGYDGYDRHDGSGDYDSYDDRRGTASGTGAHLTAAQHHGHATGPVRLPAPGAASTSSDARAQPDHPERATAAFPVAPPPPPATPPPPTPLPPTPARPAPPLPPYAPTSGPATGHGNTGPYQVPAPTPAPSPPPPSPSTHPEGTRPPRDADSIPGPVPWVPPPSSAPSVIRMPIGPRPGDDLAPPHTQPPAAPPIPPAPDSYVPAGYVPAGYVPDGYGPDGYGPAGYVPDGRDGQVPDGYAPATPPPSPPAPPAPPSQGPTWPPPPAPSAAAPRPHRPCRHRPCRHRRTIHRPT